MNSRSISTLRTKSTETKPPSEGGTRLSGRWLLVARIMWLVLVAFSLSVSAASLPAYIAALHTAPIDGIYIAWQLSPESVRELQNLGISFAVYATGATIFNIALSLLWVAFGGVLFWRKSNDWMVLLIALFLVLGGISDFTRAALDPNGFILKCLSLLFNAVTLLVLTLFPNGRFAPRWMGWLVLTAILSSGGDQSFFPNSPLNPNTWPAPLGEVFFLAQVGCFIGSLIYRYRCMSNPIQRQQIKWGVFTLIIIFSGVAIDVVVTDLLPQFFPMLSLSDLQTHMLGVLTFNLLFVLFPLAIGIAILRYRLWDIDIIINRTLVYGLLTLSVVTFYALLVVGLGTLFQAQGNFGISLLATGLIAVLFQPLHTRLQRIINRLTYGERDDPYRVLSRLGQRLEATLAPESVLPTIVETVAQALKLPYAAITLKQGEAFVIAANYGTSQGELVRFPLVYQREQIGELVLAPRSPGESLTAADRTLLTDVAHQAGVAVHAVRLTTDLQQLTRDLQHSRERLVTAREEERRRLRRDLHDGLGPQLASLTLKLETARNRLAADPLAEELLSDLTARTQAAVADIRRLVYALRPPALDELGLLSALREQALQYSTPGETGLHISLHAPEQLPELSAAVEVAVYRIAQEALTNVVRHAHARHCALCLEVDEMAGLLTLEVQDDGVGVTPTIKKGVGLVSMRERAEELGGTWTIEPVKDMGTCVRVKLPYTNSQAIHTLVTTSWTPQAQEEM